ncbi:hypothetical protein OJ996_10935 [Luteolibacter sp. GHJ8]|uniref:Cytochrome c-type biogenesis protein CcmH n=1 Tax=Luteolibacter rhizosphaerae TaxID=2989719 RepID=A0ABT3G2M4_9BACT|nr:hypothetical protein [Luteolibacter rhizosphaerae]MCW1914093.1 hypothetical protein [Luteolibacter rhizosphaerae]
MKRVPIPVVILLSAAAIALPWWQGTRHMDFLTPPSEATLARARARITASQAEKSRLFSIGRDYKEKAAIESPIRAAPAINPGDPTSPAPLNAYAEHAAEGPSAFIILAVHLEEQGGNARALLAWERVLDVCRPDDAQRQAALSGVQRLRPVVAPWNIDPLAAKALVIEATVPASIPADALEEVLTKCAHELNRHSSGLLKFEPRVERPERKGQQAPVISLQLTAEEPGGASTGFLDFPLPAEPDQLRREILSGAYKLITSQLAATRDFTPPLPLSEGESPSMALETKITRLCWSEFGKSLLPGNHP